MAANNLIDEKCIFCNVANKTVTDSELLYEDSNFVIFRDIHPAAQHHYLVVTKNHIKSGKELTAKDIDLIKEMKNIGLEFIKNKGAEANQVRMGVHWPPFNSISHLHLHVIYPTSSMSFISRIIFKTGTLWFVEVEDLIKWLSTK